MPDIKQGGLGSSTAKLLIYMPFRRPVFRRPVLVEHDATLVLHDATPLLEMMTNQNHHHHHYRVWKYCNKTRLACGSSIPSTNTIPESK